MIVRRPVTKKIDDCIQDEIDLNQAIADKRRRAYVSLIYGPNPSVSLIANAISMANSMKSSQYRRVLMYTSDVPSEYLSLLEDCGLFTEMREVDYIMGDRALFKKDWFREIFTKLHVFNMTEFSRIIFLDLDLVVLDVRKMDAVFDLNCKFAAMENSKRPTSASMKLDHGDPMLRNCLLINAGVILVTPNKKLFSILHGDVTKPEKHHAAGMTPEQFYLARVMGHQFTHLSQLYNFEVQYHGGVPITNLWKTKQDIKDIVCLHFSGGSPLSTVSSKLYPAENMGCQIDKYFVRKAWEADIDPEVQSVANKRAVLAFEAWRKNFIQAMTTLDGKVSGPNITYTTLRGVNQELQSRT
jgi:hypothetical protein